MSRLPTEWLALSLAMAIFVAIEVALGFIASATEMDLMVLAFVAPLGMVPAFAIAIPFAIWRESKKAQQ